MQNESTIVSTANISFSLLCCIFHVSLDVDDEDDEDDGEWEDGAEEIIDRKSTYDTSEREIESHQRLRHIWE